MSYKRIYVFITLLVLGSGIITTVYSQTFNDTTVISSEERVSKDLLKIVESDIKIKNSLEEDGLYLYIKKSAKIQSIMLTESAELPDNSVATYSLRTYRYHLENGDERRILNGKFITTNDSEGYFILDSSPVLDEDFGEVFVLFVPYKMHFGYYNTRRGALNLKDAGAYISIRAFGKLYADYTGGYRDNSFYIQSRLVPRTENIEQIVPDDPIIKDDDKNDVSTYSEPTLESLQYIATRSSTDVKLVSEDVSTTDIITQEILLVPPGGSLDVVIVLDTTRSMNDDIERIKKELSTALTKATTDVFFRIGLVAYKDVNEEYLTNKVDFIQDLDIFKKELNAIKIGGGGDWAEELYTGIWVALNDFDWIADNKIIFLLSDAPAHDPPKTDVNVESIFSLASEKEIKIIPLAVPQP